MRRVFTFLTWGGIVIGLTLAGVTCNAGNDGADNGGGDGNGGGGGDGPAHLVEVPDPLSGDNPRYPLVTKSVPAAGGSVTDAAFGIAQTRVVQTEGLRHEYSRLDPFNSDRTLILLLLTSAGEWRVYRTQSVPYDQSGNLVRTLDLAEPRWDPSDANLVWGLRDFQIVTVNVQTGDETVVKDFTQDATIAPILTANPDLYRITMKDEGESSTDNRYWAFMLQGTADDYRPRYLLTWDRQQDLVLGTWAIPLNESRIDWVGMSPLGNWVVIGADWDNGGGKSGMVIADRGFSQFHQIDYNAGHSDVGLDSEGNEVIVLQSNRTDSIDMLPLSPNTEPVDTGESYAGTGRVQVIRLFYDSSSPLGLNSGIHISCNAPGWCVVSTFTEPGLPEQNWLDRTITLVRLDPSHPRVFYLAKVHGTAGAYWEETQASITRDGSRVVWATNWNRNVGQERVWLIQLEIPDEAMASIGG
ncbi:MAG TPA: hypothetical protein PLL20_02215 [Phycisphaerae bacterium]|nr:hypothetical protein [Phycisphaerae bacterium]HRR85733.1 hypothetical protein [Phycisphaerae bacterium]